MKEEIKKLLGTKLFAKGVPKVTDSGEGVIKVIVATDSLDRHGEHLDIKGIDTKNYKKNPVVLFGHQYDQPPIGKAISLEKVEVNGVNQLVSEIQFAINEYPFAHLIYKLFVGGYMNAISIGFMPSDLTENEDGSITWTKSEMLEYSAVPVPANAEALMLAKSLGITQEDFEQGVVKTLEVVQKEGKILSKKNADIVSNAVTALQSVLDANSPKEESVEEIKEITKEVIIPKVIKKKRILVIR